MEQGKSENNNGSVIDMQACGTKVGNKIAERLHRAGSRIAETADDGLSAVGAKMQGIAASIKSEASPEGTVGSTVRAVAEGIESGGSYLVEKDLSAIAKDAGEVVRRNPITALCIGLGLGFFVGQALTRR